MPSTRNDSRVLWKSLRPRRRRATAPSQRCVLSLSLSLSLALSLFSPISTLSFSLFWLLSSQFSLLASLSLALPRSVEAENGRPPPQALKGHPTHAGFQRHLNCPGLSRNASASLATRTMLLAQDPVCYTSSELKHKSCLWLQFTLPLQLLDTCLGQDVEGTAVA